MNVYNEMTTDQQKRFDAIVTGLLLRGYKLPKAINVAEISILHKDDGYPLQ